MRHNRKYLDKIFNNTLPTLPEDERIYLNVEYSKRSLAKYSNCGFDSIKKLWFTGIYNCNLYILVETYGINDATSEKLRKLVEERLRN